MDNHTKSEADVYEIIANSNFKKDAALQKGILSVLKCYDMLYCPFSALYTPEGVELWNT